MKLNKNSIVYTILDVKYATKLRTKKSEQMNFMNRPEEYYYLKQKQCDILLLLFSMDDQIDDAQNKGNNIYYLDIQINMLSNEWKNVL